MALIWKERLHERERDVRPEPIDWVGVYVWCLLGASVILALGTGAWLGR